MSVRKLILALALLVGADGAALAQSGEIAIAYSGETTLYGSCLPTLQARNATNAAIDFLQVDLSVTLADGRRRVMELKSRYRWGLDNPIGAGEARTLKVNLDEAMPLGGACSDIIAISIAGIDCIGINGACPGKVVPTVGDAIVRPR